VANPDTGDGPRRSSEPDSAALPPVGGSPKAEAGKARPAAVAAMLAVLTVIVYTPSLSNRFVNWDDGEYVSHNAFLSNGMTWGSVRWSMVAFHAGNWHPLTWLSHAADVSLYGQKAAWGHHLTSVLLHAASAAILLLALSRLTGRLWPSAFVAALFALHPLHVESVSWASERKDVLCALFAFLALWAHSWHAAKPSWRRYLAVAACVAAALMSKPMAITLPFVLLVLDWWPLGRLSWRSAAEKAPLVAMAAGAGILTWMAQSQGHTVSSLRAVAFQTRLAHAEFAYVSYLIRALWPAPGTLSPFYPLSWRGGEALTTEMAQFCLIVLVAVTVAAFYMRRKRPYLLAGWLIYAGMLVPVSGLVQVGRQMMADRYTYIPLVGVFLAVAWAVSDAARLRAGIRGMTVVAAACVMCALACLTWQQQAVWHDTETLWNRVVANYPRCAQGWLSLGHVYAGLDPDERLKAKADSGKAESYYRKAVSVAPEDNDALSSLGSWLASAGRFDEAETCFKRCLEVAPRDPGGHYDYGDFLLDRGRIVEAEREFRRTLEMDPRHANALRAIEAIRARG
jgi:protein O-mannosyl-transferase